MHRKRSVTVVKLPRRGWTSRVLISSNFGRRVDFSPGQNDCLKTDIINRHSGTPWPDGGRRQRRLIDRCSRVIGSTRSGRVEKSPSGTTSLSARITVTRQEQVSREEIDRVDSVDER